MKTVILFFTFIISMPAWSQQQSYDMLHFTPPKGWKKTAATNSLSFDTVNNTKKSWARIAVWKSTTSKGNLQADFESDWQDFAVKKYSVSSSPLAIDTLTVDGWKVKSGMGKFVFNKDTATLAMTTFSDGQRYTSVMMMTNGKGYGDAIERFLSSVKLPTAGVPIADNTPTVSTTTTNATGFQFSTTNFDDGWTAVAKEDWVELTKGKLKALLHYPREEDKKYYSQYSEHVSVFWNLLVAPRYSNLREYQSPGYNHSYEPGLFGAGLLNDNATKKDVWVALFSKGKSGWVEVIAPDKTTFVQAFGVDNPDTYFDKWDALLNLTRKNYFAVGEADLVGKWSSNFSSSTAYYNVYTGIYVGAGVFGSASSFDFKGNKTYNWQIAVGQSQPGTLMKVDQGKSSGTWKLLGNWQVWCSEIERKPTTYNAYFSCFKGGRILWLQDVSYGSYTAYGKVSN